MSIVDSSKLPTVALIIVAVLALSATAATINSTVGGPQDQAEFKFEPDPDLDPDADADGGGGSVGEGGDVASRQSIDLTICIEVLRTPAAILGILGIVLLFFVGLYRRYNAATTLLVGSGVIPIVFGAYFFLTNCAAQFGGEIAPDSSINPAAGGSLVQAPAVPPVVIGIVLVGLIGLIAVLLISVTGDDEEFRPIDDEQVEEPDAADFAAAAGRAADRIEQANVAVDNAVYRAWLEMTNLLDLPNPKSSAPMDFAEEAIDFGLDEQDVMELTELFNEVRYGHMDAESRENRAIEILRHFESEYATTTRDEFDGAGDGA